MQRDHEFVPQAADFVERENRCFGYTAAPARSTRSKLRAAVAFGSERTMEQDPMFAFSDFDRHSPQSPVKGNQ